MLTNRLKMLVAGLLGCLCEREVRDEVPLPQPGATLC
jgi:hypothetical protein